MFKILLLEDEQPLVDTLPAVLKDADADFEVVGTTDIAEALAKIATEAFDAVILDISMPPLDDMDFDEIEYGRLTGVAVAQRIQEIKPELPIVALTVVFDLREQCAKHNISLADIIYKPTEVSNIVHSLRNAIEKTHPTQES